MGTTYRVFLSDGSEIGEEGHYAWFIAADYGDHVDGQYAESEVVEAADAAEAVDLLFPVEEWAKMVTRGDIVWREPTDEERWQAGDPPLHLVGEEKVWTLREAHTYKRIGLATEEQTYASLRSEPDGIILIDADGNLVPEEEWDARKTESGARWVYVVGPDLPGEVAP